MLAIRFARPTRSRGAFYVAFCVPMLVSASLTRSRRSDLSRRRKARFSHKNGARHKM